METLGNLFCFVLLFYFFFYFLFLKNFSIFFIFPFLFYFLFRFFFDVALVFCVFIVSIFFYFPLLSFYVSGCFYFFVSHLFCLFGFVFIVCLIFCLFAFFSFFCHVGWLVGSWFPNQGSNLSPVVGVPSPGCWTPREFLTPENINMCELSQDSSPWHQGPPPCNSLQATVLDPSGQTTSKTGQKPTHQQTACLKLY